LIIFVLNDGIAYEWGKNISSKGHEMSLCFEYRDKQSNTSQQMLPSFNNDEPQNNLIISNVRVNFSLIYC